ncbi:hypothetical protein Tco_0763333 [Tanacetum coccineum]
MASIRRIRGFLGVGTTFDIFQNIYILYLEYDVLVFSGYGVLILFPSWSFVKYRHRYVVSPLMDTTRYLMSSQINNLDNILRKARQTDQTLRMLLLKEDNVYTGKHGLGFENQNDDVNPSLLRKAKELAPCLYNIDEMGKGLLSNHKIVSEEELKCKAENIQDSKAKKEQFLKQIASLESKLASGDLISNQREYCDLRTSYNALKAKFDALNQDKGKSPISNFSTPIVSVSKKIYTGESSKSFKKKDSQFTAYSLQKDRKFPKKPQVFETPTSQKAFKSVNSSKKKHAFETLKSRSTPVRHVWRPKQSHSKPFKYSKSEMLSLQNKNDSNMIIPNSGRFLLISKMNSQNETSGFNNRWKSSSSLRYKTLQENQSFHNKWENKRNFKSPLIPRALFPNETPVSSPCWNSTSLHKIDTTFKWFSKFGKPVGTVLKWVPKVLV